MIRSAKQSENRQIAASVQLQRRDQPDRGLVGRQTPRRLLGAGGSTCSPRTNRRGSLRSVNGRSPTAYRAMFHPAGNTLVFTAGRTLFVWDTVAARETNRLRLEAKYFMDAAYTPDGNRLLTVSKEGVVRVWDTATWECGALVRVERTSRGCCAPSRCRRTAPAPPSQPATPAVPWCGIWSRCRDPLRGYPGGHGDTTRSDTRFVSLLSAAAAHSGSNDVVLVGAASRAARRHNAL